VNRFRAAYAREIEPMTDKTQWPRVELHLYLKGKWEDEENLELKGVLRVDIRRNAPNLQKVTMMVQV
jgi:hypothetical protein